MALRELLTVDVNKLSAVEAGFVAEDITTTLVRGDIDGVKQQKLKALLGEARPTRRHSFEVETHAGLPAIAVRRH